MQKCMSGGGVPLISEIAHFLKCKLLDTSKYNTYIWSFKKKIMIISWLNELYKHPLSKNKQTNKQTFWSELHVWNTLLYIFIHHVYWSPSFLLLEICFIWPKVQQLFGDISFFITKLATNFKLTVYLENVNTSMISSKYIEFNRIYIHLRYHSISFISNVKTLFKTLSSI